MMTYTDRVKAYIEAEIERYFPSAVIEATFHDDGSVVDVDGEAIEVTVSADADSDPDYTLIMQIGSDDDWFSFSDGSFTITVPFPEWISEEEG